MTASLGLLFLSATALAAEPNQTFLGKSADQWLSELKSESASQRHLAAWALAQSPPSPIDPLFAAAKHDDPAVRYWSVQGISKRALADPQDPAAVQRAADKLVRRLADESKSVRVAAAEACVRLNRPDVGLKVLAECLSDPQESVRIQAITSLERLGWLAVRLTSDIRAATADESEYVKRISTRSLRRLAKQP